MNGYFIHDGHRTEIAMLMLLSRVEQNLCTFFNSFPSEISGYCVA